MESIHIEVLTVAAVVLVVLFGLMQYRIYLALKCDSAKAHLYERKLKEIVDVEFDERVDNAIQKATGSFGYQWYSLFFFMAMTIVIMVAIALLLLSRTPASDNSPVLSEPDTVEAVAQSTGATMVLVLVTVMTTLAALATCVMAWLTCSISKSNRLANLIAVRENMPVLNFRVDQSESPAWIVENVGKGVAMNVLLAHEMPDGKLEYPLRDYNALGPGMSYRITWMSKPFKFIAQYTDSYGSRYTEICVGNVNKNTEGWLYEDWSQREKRPYWRMVVMREIVPDDVSTSEA